MEKVRIGKLNRTCHTIQESPVGNSVGQRYDYQLSQKAKDHLVQLDRTQRGQQLAQEVTPFESLAGRLVQTDLRVLELAATILYFQQLNQDWSVAISKTATFKGVAPSSTEMPQAEALAKAVVSERQKTVA